MEASSSLFSEEDDGSLIILSRITSETDSAAFPHLSMKDEEPEFTTLTSNLPSTPPTTMSDGSTNSKNSMTDSQLAESNGGDADEEDFGILSRWEIDQIIKKEQENLQLVKMANEMMKSLVMKSSACQLEKDMRDAAINTTQMSAALEEEEESMIKQPDPIEKEDLQAPVGPTMRPYQKLFRRISNNFRRRRQPNKPNNNRNNPAVNVQTFVQDYYRSLDSISRYIIGASILSFVTAFLLLSWYGAQTHSHDMELFQLKEKRVLANQEAFEKFQLQNENFREVLMHQRYEETRECQSSLQLCHSKRDELLSQISQIEMDVEKDQTKLESKMATQQKNIQTLEAKIRELQEQNKELRKEIGQSLSSSYAQILLSFLNIAMNRSVQIAFGTAFTIGILFIIVCTAFSK